MNRSMTAPLIGCWRLRRDCGRNRQSEDKKGPQPSLPQEGIAFLFGGVHGLNGMVTTFLPGQTGCLECLFPERPVIETPPGVLGPAPGLIASIQTMEAVKILVGFGQLLKGRLLYFRGFDILQRSDPRKKPGLPCVRLMLTLRSCKIARSRLS